MAVKVVCISRSSGAGGEEVGRLVAERLHLRYVDEEIIGWAAEREGLDAKDVASVEQRKGWLARFFGGLGEGADPEMYAFGGFVGSEGSSLRSSEGYRELIKEAIRQTFEQGGSVIVAHAASHALSGQEGVLRVFITASPQIRAGRLAQELGLEEQAAAKKIKESDAARADYLLRFYEVDRELPTHYDLVCNTDALSAERVAALVTQAASG
jgi:cytidylate kinase